MREKISNVELIRRSWLRFSQMRTTAPAQQAAPRRITGARNVTRKPALGNEAIELSQSIWRARFGVCPESNSIMRVRGETDFRLCSRDPT
jgi:hypothetical protein